MKEAFPHIKYFQEKLDTEEVASRAKQFRESLLPRRSLRFFSPDPIPKTVIEDILITASSAPSGANKQPWTFCAVSDPMLKSKIREAAEKEEFENYHGRMSDEWIEDLRPLGTDWEKPFLEIAPWLIVVFKQVYGISGGNKKRHYYVNESVGLACGFLLTAIHNAGLVALTHTPSPMNFLQELLQRPENERAFLLIPVGFPAKDATVPDIHRKGLDQVAIFFE